LKVLKLINDIAINQGMRDFAEAKTRGIDVTADVGIAHLHLTDMDISSFNTSSC
jgi:dihydroorotase-like cyclic amidohydrolase